MFTWTKRLTCICLAFLFSAVSISAQGRNTIEGRIYGPNGNPIQNIRVVLKNGNFSEIRQDITDEIGSYRFLNISEGLYYIDINPFGTPYEGQTRRAPISSLSLRQGGAAEIYHYDFQLRLLAPTERPLPKKLAEALAFAQEVPPMARQKFKDGQKLLEKEKKEEAWAAMRGAIEIFPDYFEALEALGMEYVKAGYFDVAVPIFLQAIDVNPKAWRSYFGIGSAYSSLSMRSKSIEALKKSIDLNPTNSRSYLMLGSELAKTPESLDEAVTVYQKLIKLEPTEASEPYAALAAIYTKQGKFKEAADSLETYLKTATDIKDPKPVREKIKELRKKASTT